MKKSYLGYAPKQSNVVKLANYISSAQNTTTTTKQTKPLKKGNKKRF